MEILRKSYKNENITKTWTWTLYKKNENKEHYTKHEDIIEIMQNMKI